MSFPPLSRRSFLPAVLLTRVTVLVCLLGLMPLVVHSRVSAQLRIVSYNTASGGQDSQSSQPRSGIATVLEAIGNDEMQGIARPIDILLLQEQSAAATTTAAIVDMLDAIYGPGVYARGFRDGQTQGAGRPGIIYNTTTVELLAERPIGMLRSDGAVRQPMQYRVRPLGYDQRADLYLYNSHYKASSGPDNEARRQVEAAMVRAHADSLGDGIHVVYAGDFNIQRSSEPMYETLLAAGPGQAFDPVNEPGHWNNSNLYRHLHTQSPADGQDASLVGGGMDDRFDFQLVSGELLDGEGLSYIAGSYRAFGNNGSHLLNAAVNVSRNTAQPRHVLDALAASSDHLPVVADYQLPAWMNVQLASFPARVFSGDPLPLIIDVANVAPVQTANGADELDYIVRTQGAVSGLRSGSLPALDEPRSHTLFVERSTLGPHSGQVEVLSDSPAAMQDYFTETVAFTVLEHATPSLALDVPTPSLTVDLGIFGQDLPPAGGHSATWSGTLANLATSAPEWTASLDVDGISTSGDSEAFQSDLSFPQSILANDAVTWNVSLSTADIGQFSATWSVRLSDEDLLGGADYQLTLQLMGQVALPGDANLDGVVDGSDFAIWNAHKFTPASAWGEGDFDRDGFVSAADFEIWANHRFRSLADSPVLTVPEPLWPSTWWLLALLIVSRVTFFPSQPVIAKFARGQIVSRSHRATE